MKPRKKISFNKAYSAVTKAELFALAEVAFRQRGVPEDKIYEAIYRYGHRMKLEAARAASKTLEKG